MAEVRALQDVGQFNASIEELREILAVAPDLPEATYRLGVALVQTGDPSRAVWALEKASESSEFAIPASLLLASAHFGAQNYEAAIEASNRVLELDPERHAALRMRAQSLVGAGKPAQAMEDTERLLELFPDDYGVWVLYATLLSENERSEESERAHDKIKELALTGGDPAVAHRGCLAPAVFARDERKDLERAEELYDDCVERFPANGFVAREAMAFYDQIGKPEKSTELIRQAVEAAPENLSIRSQLANRLQRAGKTDEAMAVLQEAVESFKSAGAWNLLANFHRQRGEHKEALAALEQVVELSGGANDQVRFTQADVLIDLGELEKAERLTDSIQETTYTTLLRGRIKLERDDLEGALALFDEGIRSWPNNAGARYLAGITARRLGMLDRAVSELREAVRSDNHATPAAELLARVFFERGDYNDAIQMGRVALGREGANADDVLVVLIRAMGELEKYKEARETAATLGKLPGKRPLAIVEIASLARAASGPAAAVDTIEQSGLPLDDPETSFLLRAYADHLAAGERTPQALAAVEAALVAHPEFAPYHELRGTLLQRLERSDEARQAFERAVALDPEYGPAHAGLATLAAVSRDYARAIELFDRASELAPETSAFLYSAAQLSLVTGDTAGAERRLRDAVRRFPGHAGARNDLAWILAEAGRELDEALVLAQQAQRLEPSPEVLDTLGWVHFRRGELAAAVEALEQAVEARADSPSIRYRLGVALAKAGDAERAREELEAAVAAGAFPEAADAQRELARIGTN